MNRGGFWLGRRLAFRLGLLFVLATAGATGALWFSGTMFTQSLQSAALEQQAATVARYLVAEPGGPVRLDPPPEMIAGYADGAVSVVVRDAGGIVVAALPPTAAGRAGGWTAPRDSLEFFEIEAEGGEAERYGVNVRYETAAGPVWITVIDGNPGGDALVQSMLAEFFAETWWKLLPFIGLVLAVGTWTLRAGLRSMQTLSQKAEQIGPAVSHERLPTDNVPNEIRPLVDAVNGAFDRLEQGIRAQREFGANAAHQLRTPLAILTARLDSLAPNEQSAALRRDVERINRIVQQLLKVARLDALPLDVSQTVDLRAVAAEAIGYAAPLAVKRRRGLALTGTTAPVWVLGNADAIGDAVVNLLENAIAHAPENSTVSVTVSPDGLVTVSDRGPGIPVDQRDEVLHRFARGRNAQGDGAGLGLAIVSAIARQHRAGFRIDENPGGGARMELRFALAAP